jgi:glycosyltransferase involved in cell wall biosynthesis
MIWTLHDMWPFTGGCHYSLGCTNFRSNCEKCPQVKKVFSKIPRDSLLVKSKFFELNKKNLILVAPSVWIADLASTSVATKRLQIVEIPNPVNLDVFKPNQFKSGSYRTHRSNFELIIGCGSMNLNDPLKGVDKVLKAAQELSRNTQKRIKVIAVGKGGFPNFKNTENLEIQYTGLLTQKEMANFFNQIDLFLHMAKEENYPNVLIESLASRVPIICLKSAGMTHIVEQSKAGYIVEHEKDLIQLLSQLIHDVRPLQSKGEAGRLYSVNNLSSEVIAKRYIELYSELLKSLNSSRL